MSLHNSQEWNLEETGVRSAPQQEPANPKDVLVELFELLEDYGPCWYTEEHHYRTLAALGIHHQS